MTIHVATSNHNIEEFLHVISASVDGESMFLTINYSDGQTTKTKVYETGQWINFYFNSFTVGGY